MSYLYYLTSSYNAENSAQASIHYRQMLGVFTRLVKSGYNVVSSMVHLNAYRGDLVDHDFDFDGATVRLLDACDAVLVYSVPRLNRCETLNFELEHAKKHRIPIWTIGKDGGEENFGWTLEEAAKNIHDTMATSGPPLSMMRGLKDIKTRQMVESLSWLFATEETQAQVRLYAGAMAEQPFVLSVLGLYTSNSLMQEVQDEEGKIDWDMYFASLREWITQDKWRDTIE